MYKFGIYWEAFETDGEMVKFIIAFKQHMMMAAGHWSTLQQCIVNARITFLGLNVFRLALVALCPC